jgi:hypothetical protein
MVTQKFEIYKGKESCIIFNISPSLITKNLVGNSRSFWNNILENVGNFRQKMETRGIQKKS